MNLTQKMWDMLHALWIVRPCLICGKSGYCAHREIEFDLAELEAHARRLHGAA